MRNRAVRRCLILLPLLVSAATSAKSNDPSPSPSEIRKPEQSKPSEPKAPAQKNQDRTAVPPLIIKEAPASQAQKESAENAKEADSKTATDWWMVWLTGILAFVAFLQLIVFGLQARRLRQTIETMEKIGTDQSKDMQGWIAVAKESADAAKKSADVAAGYSRPMLFVSEIYFQEGQVRVDGLSLRAKIVVEIKNFGETPAFLRRSCVDIAVGVQEGYLDVLTHKTGEAVDKRRSHILKPARVADLLQDDAALNEVINWRKILHCYGFVEYSDYLGELYICRFCKCYAAPDKGAGGGWYDDQFGPKELRECS